MKRVPPQICLGKNGDGFTGILMFGLHLKGKIHRHPPETGKRNTQEESMKHSSSEEVQVFARKHLGAPV